jgi:thiol-disulfide isomerase/thioredoxin
MSERQTRTILCRAFVAFTLAAALPVNCVASPQSKINDQLKNLRDLPAAQRPAATVKLALDIRALPAGQQKLQFADALRHLATEGGPSRETLQAVADTLAKALAETPVPAKGDRIPMPYLDLAELAHYEDVTATLDDPLYAKALKQLADQDAEVEKADFTLKDLHNKPVTLSQLRGKIVIVNFWATWCPPCRTEMPTLDTVYTRFQSQDLVVLSITDEDSVKVSSFLGGSGYHPPVLIDPGGKVHKLFHIDGIPRTFVFNREGKLVGQSIDDCTPQQLLTMLQKTDLHN